MVLFSSFLSITIFWTSSLHPFLNSHNNYLFINPVRLTVWLPQPVFLRSYSLKAHCTMSGGTCSTHLGPISGNGIGVHISATNITIYSHTHHAAWGQEDIRCKMGNSFTLFLLIWFLFPHPKMQVFFNSQYFVIYPSPKTSSAQIFQLPHVFRNPPNTYSAQIAHLIQFPQL